MLNVMLLVSDGDKPWTEFLAFNAAASGVIMVMHNQKRTWARRLLYGYLAMTTVVLVVVFIWVVFKHGLYEVPAFYQIMLQVLVAMLPLALAMLVGSETCRTRVFKGRWWPVFTCWGLIAVISLGTAFYMGPTTLTAIWVAMAFMALTLAIMCVIFVTGAAAMCYGGLKGSAACMRLLAIGIRRLT